MIEKCLEDRGNHFIASYPWLQDPTSIPEHYNYTLKRLESTERSLKRNESSQKLYQEQIEDMVKRGVARKLSQSEIECYTGPTHYIPHSGVLKPGSLSTPLRIVMDSRRLNVYLAKGPDCYMINMLTVLLRFREKTVGIVGDIRKMYNSVYIKELEQHMHRFLWRDMEIERVPDTYVMLRVSMGARPSGTIASLALRKTAIKGQMAYPEAAEAVLESSYVDDIVDSVDSVEEANVTTEQISELLEPGNFHVKGWTISHEKKSQEKVLGVVWDPETDTLQFNVNLKFGKPKPEGFIGPLEKESTEIPSVLTKRIVMSAMYTFDPVGLVTPFTIKGKILVRDLWALKVDWDTQLSQFEHTRWTQFFTEMLSLPSLRFQRSVKPNDAADKPPILVTFSDGSKEAFGCCCYARWELIDGSFEARLIASKSRVAPLRATTIVRLELSSAVLAKRLRLFIEEAFRLEFERVIHITDSQIVRAMINNDSHGFNTFVATRIGEIQSGTNPLDWCWIDTKLNIADIISRGAAISELGIYSCWQNGPIFITYPIKDWPIRSDYTLNEELPEKIVHVFSTTIQSRECIQINIDRFSNFLILIRVTGRIIHFQATIPHRLRNLSITLKPCHLKEARSFWEREAQGPIRRELEQGTKGSGPFRKLNVTEVDGVFVAVGRVEAWSYSKNKRVVLPRTHRYSKLYAEHIHNIAHRGVNSDVAKVRLEYWIVGVTRLMRSIRYGCVTCRKREGKLQQQIMAPLPIERLKPAPMWYHTGIDLFGPFQIKGEVNKRTVGKGYGVIFTCLLTRGVFIDIATDYSTDGFLLVFRRFVSLRGYPAKIFSDPGSQLKQASKELNEMFQQFEWDRIKEVGARNGLEWIFSPADASWYNGCCEALIRSVKKCIYHAIGDAKVTFSEMQTILYESANIVNERPIGITPTSVEDGTYLSPNDLMLGRSSNKVPAGEFELTSNSKRRLYFVQRVCDSFWKKWITSYFPSLLERPKWHHERRNVRIGDIVIIQDAKLKRSQWKLGIITQATKGVDNRVRRVKVEYVNVHSGSATRVEVERPVQQLVVILAVDEIASV